jgi:hypothetical protein
MLAALRLAASDLELALVCDSQARRATISLIAYGSAAHHVSDMNNAYLGIIVLLVPHCFPQQLAHDSSTCNKQSPDHRASC